MNQQAILQKAEQIRDTSRNKIVKLFESEFRRRVKKFSQRFPSKQFIIADYFFVVLEIRNSKGRKMFGGDISLIEDARLRKTVPELYELYEVFVELEEVTQCMFDSADAKYNQKESV